MNFSIRKITDDDRAWVKSTLTQYWGSELVITRGKKHYADALPGFIAENELEKTGLVTFSIDKDQCEIITLNSFIENNGIGTSLIERVKQAAKENTCKRIWLITTNDNLRALGFYQKRDFLIKAIHANAIEESRKLKPGIPLSGKNDIPIRDEIELEIKF